MTDNPFLPNDYVVSDSSNGYMKFEQGANKFRILEKPIIGYVYWVHADGTVVPSEETFQKGNKPVRIEKSKDKYANPIPGAALETAKEFWAMPVWNYKLEQVQILEITQKTILRTITTLARDPEWGSPLGYDITVARTGEKFETTYEVVPAPPKPLSEEIKKRYEEAQINTKALFEGGDPFSKELDVPSDLGDIDEILKDK